MDDKAHTTATLRETLFNTIQGVLDGSISERQASAVASVSDKIIKTAELEMKYTEHLVEIDKTGTASGPMHLGNNKLQRIETDE